MGILEQICDQDQKMHEEILHLLVQVSWQWGTVGKTNEWKTSQKLKITGVKIAWVDVKSNKYPQFDSYAIGLSDVIVAENSLP